jgi:tetratricopeptide (TPR) repeat protein
LTGEDLYTIEKDVEWSDRIASYEALQRSDKADFEATVALGRMYALVSMSRKAIPLLKSAKQRSPKDARPLKYLAVAFVNGFYQYDAALKELNAYTALVPQDIFGHQFRGYVHYCQQTYDKAVADLETALRLDPDDCYAHFYLTCAYAGLYQKASRLDPRRRRYEERFRFHRLHTRSFADKHPLRAAWLNRFYPNEARHAGK